MTLEMATKKADPNSGTRALIEIKSGSKEKKVYDEGSKALSLRRMLPEALPKNVNYGFIQNTMADDGDPLDVFVLSSRDLNACEEVDVRPIAVIRTHDEKGPDDKIVAIDLFDYQGHHSDSVHSIIRDIGLVGLAEFVSRSKDNANDKWVNVIGVEGVDAANRKILESVLR